MGQITVSKCYTEDGVEIEGLKVIEPKVFGDSRGYFYEVYNYCLLYTSDAADE